MLIKGTAISKIDDDDDDDSDFLNARIVDPAITMMRMKLMTANIVLMLRLKFPYYLCVIFVAALAID